MARGKLRYALDRHQGRNIDLEKQRKLQREAAKKRGEQQQSGDEPEFEGPGNAGASEDENWEDEDEGSEAADGMNLDAKLNDEDDDEDEDAEEDASDASGVPFSDIESLDSEDKADVIPYQRLTINNIDALTKAHRSIALPKSSEFSTHQITTSSEQVEIPDVHDDIAREATFYKQSLEAAVEGRAQLLKEGVPFTRPNDYFAEMVKTDEHMGKIQAKIVQAASDKRASAEAKKQRDLKKRGKKIQVTRLQERDAARKQTLDKINQLKRKRRGGAEVGEREEDMFDVALDDATKKRGDDRPKAGSKNASQPNAKRRRKDEKFGFGGKKRFSKSGDAKSSGDLSEFSAKRMKGQTKSTKRPGKSRRATAAR